MDTDNRNYLLVIKRRNNDFLPVEWHLTKFYNNENLNTLEGIDSFTRKITSLELIEEIVAKNLVEPTEQFEKFAIIYISNNKTRELKEGTFFKENNIIFSEDDLIKLIIKNKNNKDFLNQIYNICNIKTSEEKIQEFKFIIKNLDLFEARGENGLKAALSIFKEISYAKKRTIILKITDTVLIRLSSESINLNE
jgi:hypothetical protein